MQGTYETFVEMGRQHFGGDLAGKWILTAGLGGMGGAQPLAATMAGASMLAIECQPERIDKRLETRYLDVAPSTLDEALEHDRRARAATASADLGRPARQRRRGAARAAATRRAARCGHRPDLRARPGQRLPAGAAGRVEQWDASARATRRRVAAAARESMARHVRGDARVPARRAFRCSTTATTSARSRSTRASKNAFDFPGFVPAYIRPLFCRGIGPFRWVALSGDPEDIYRTDAKVKELIPDDAHLHRWLDMARERIQFQGLPARICWVGLGQRHRLGLAFNEMVRSGELKAPDRHRPRSPRLRLGREPEPRNRSDAGRLRRGLRLAAAQCAAEHRERRDLGVDPSRRRRRHGLLAACRRRHRLRRHRRRRARIERVLWNDPATGVMRHADAGYEIAVDCAREQGLNLPFLD